MTCIKHTKGLDGDSVSIVLIVLSNGFGFHGTRFFKLVVDKD
jgi:hypothetical protein